MSLISLGDLAHSFVMRRQNVTLKAQVQALGVELSTGRAADTARHVRGDFTALSGIEASLTRLNAYAAATSEIALEAGAMQTAFSAIGTLTADLGQSLLVAAESGAPTMIDDAGGDARQRFETMVSLLNTRFGDRTLFAGVGTDGPALTAPGTILDALEAEIAGAATANDLVAAVDAWFAAPTGFAATAYLGGAPRPARPIAPGEAATIGITAMDPALVDTIKAMATAALLDRGALAANPSERAELARQAGESLIDSGSARVHLAAGLGTVEGQVERATARNSAESSALQIARSDLVSVDPFETATKLESAQTQLETLYAVTARMSRLSLVDFLR
ncbi:flagellin [Paracoccaceae bacterium Fryx2]|nr:flagellin [Paracoccaceae bacterium Fryx2]